MKVLVGISKEKLIYFIKRGYTGRVSLQVPNHMFDFITEDYIDSVDLEEKIDKFTSKYGGIQNTFLLSLYNGLHRYSKTLKRI